MCQQLQGLALLMLANKQREEIGLAQEIAEYVRVSGALTSLDVRGNDLGDAGNGLLRDAVKTKSGFELQV